MRLSVLVLALSLNMIPLAAKAAAPVCAALPDPALRPTEAVPAPLNNDIWRDRTARADALRAAASPDNTRLVFLGDSLTSNWPRALWVSAFSPYGALNLGVSGDVTQGLLWRLQHNQWGSGAASLHPRLVVVMIGTNNLAAGSTGPNLAIGVKAVLDFVRNRSPKTRILLLTIWPRRGSPQLQEAREEANALLRLCAETMTVRVLDLAAILTDANGELLPDLFRDRLHLTDAGYAAILTVLAPIVAQMMTEEPRD